MTVASAPWIDSGDPPTPLSVSALVAGALRRDGASERQIYLRYAPALRRFARGLLGCPHDASDAVQETFERAFRLLPTLSRPADFAPWLHGIARNVCLECLKSRRRARRAHPWARNPDPSTDASSPEREMIGRQTAQIVRRALEGMPAARREALSLRVDHALSYREIAAFMGWSLPKAKVEVHRARRAIDAALRAPERHARQRARWLPATMALVIALSLTAVLLGAAPGVPADDGLLASQQPSVDSSALSPGPDAGTGEPICEQPVEECESPPAPLRSTTTSEVEPLTNIPWSDAPVTKALEAP